MTCNVLATGSKGNAVLLDGKYLFDCGVPFKKINPYLKKIRAVFLTHIHTDHFNSRTISEIHSRRPGIKFICCKNMLTPLIKEAGVDVCSVHLVEPDVSASIHFFGGKSGTEILRVIPVELIHNVENYGYIVFQSKTDPEGAGICEESAIYATDTHHIPISAPGLDLYMVENNHRAEELTERKAWKQEQGLFSYEDKVAAAHMSHETITAWLAGNVGTNSRVVFLHGHEKQCHGERWI